MRHHAVSNLKERLGRNPDRGCWTYINRDMLEQVCEEFEIPIEEDDNVPDLRHKIRMHFVGRDTKERQTKLSTDVISKIARELKYRQDYIHAEDVDLTEVGKGDTVVINGDEYTVARHAWSRKTHDEEAYSGWDMLTFKGRRMRLMQLHDLDRNQCYYRTDLVLEKARDYGPYKRWARKSYVESFDVQ